MKIVPCASSSRGNMYLISHEGRYIVIDAGIAGTRILEYCKTYGGALSKLDGFLITHIHGDHCSGLEIFAKKYQKLMPITPFSVYAHPHTLKPLQNKHPILLPYGKEFLLHETKVLGGMTVTAFEVPHDVHCYGYLITVGEEKIGICTDLGFMPPPVLDCLKGTNTVILEANYDPETLHFNTKYAASEKNRIFGKGGHLCNGEAGWTVGNLLDYGLKTVIFAHMSGENNTEEMVRTALTYELSELKQNKEVQVLFAPRKAPEFSLDVGTGEVLSL